MKVLIIDDNKDVRKLLKIVMEIEYNAECVTAENGVEGIKKYDNDNFDLVITDFEMPIKNGEFVLAHILDKTKTILMSGIMDESLQGMASILYTNACLQKPFTIDIFKKTMKNIGF
jgi:YesN/AraC family two-component response regulator